MLLKRLIRVTTTLQNLKPKKIKPKKIKFISNQKIMEEYFKNRMAELETLKEEAVRTEDHLQAMGYCDRLSELIDAKNAYRQSELDKLSEKLKS